MNIRFGSRTKWLAMISSLIFLLAACAPQVEPGNNQSTATPNLAIDAQSTPSIADSNTELGPITLRLWIPPSFSTFSGDLSSTILSERLALFHEQNPNVQIEIRLKEVEGSGSLIDSWANAAEAAPLALPDLVLLDNDQFDLAISSDLLPPLSSDEVSALGSDWYSFGTQMVEADGSRYGWPFAGDAMILMHRFSAIEEPPTRWEQVLAEPLVLAFAAGNSEANFSLLQYEALLNASGQATNYESIEDQELLSVFNFLSQGRANGNFPFWLAQLETDEQSWQAYSQGQSPMVITWSNRFFSSNDPNQGAGYIPSADGSIHSYVRSWAWAVASQDSSRRSLAISLAEFLSDAEFMAQWSSAAGFLPARESALTAWAPSPQQALALQIAPFAAKINPLEIRSEVGTAVSNAQILLLKDEIDSPNAVQQIQAQLVGP